MSATEAMPWVALLVACLICCAFFAGVETGAYSINRLRLAVRAERGDRRARLLVDELKVPNRWLATLLIGNVLMGDLSSHAIGHLLDGAGFSTVSAMAINAVVLLPLLVIFGETLPKELFRIHCDSWTLRAAPAVRLVRWLFTGIGAVPLVQWLGDALVRRCALAPSEVVDARQRVVELLREGRGAVDERQVGMAGRVLQLARRQAGDLMTPWKRVRTLSEGATPPVVRETLRSRPQARYPVTDPAGRCVGLATALDLLADPDTPPSEVARPAVMVGPSTPALEVLRLLRQGGVSLAVVADGDRPIGVIGLRDLLEPVVGSLPGW
jgi:CBS domain containing-hemolysin-like protein